jgi:hypothetical protein
MEPCHKMLDCDTAVIHPLSLPPGNDIKASDNVRSPVPDAVWARKAVCSSCWFWTREAGDAQDVGDHLQHRAVSDGTTPKMGGSSFPGHSRSHIYMTAQSNHPGILVVVRH